jgi:glycosyltransferase involved in cell wall biosynthesis
MKIAIVTPRYPPTMEGGGERSVQLLANYLSDSSRIDDLTVLSFDGKTEDHIDNVRVCRLGNPSSFFTEYQNLVVIPKLRRKLTEYDVVHAYNMELHPAVGYLSSELDIPSVGTLNSYHFFPKSVSNTTPSALERIYELVGHRTTNKYLLRYIRKTDQFTALSKSVKDIYAARGFDRGRITVIPNMIDPLFTMPYSSPSGHYYTLLYVGNVTETKGVHHLIEAMTELPETYRLQILGGGNIGRFRALADRLGVLQRIEFTGWVPHDRVAEAYASADMFVHPGIWPEPFGRTVIEAMQSKLPVVCTDIGGPPDIVRDEEMICDPENPTDLAATIKHTRDLDRDVGKANYEYVRDYYSPSTIGSQYIDLYYNLDTISD